MIVLPPHKYRVVKGVHKGLSNKLIAHELGYAHSTVKMILSSVFTDLGNCGRVTLALMFERGEISEGTRTIIPSSYGCNGTGPSSNAQMERAC